jgi:FG-GAP repeat
VPLHLFLFSTNIQKLSRKLQYPLAQIIRNLSIPFLGDGSLHQPKVLWQLSPFLGIARLKMFYHFYKIIKIMKKVYSLLAILFFAINVFAQNVGVNNTDPQVALDVQGALRNRPTSFNIATTPIVVTSNIGFVILTGTNTSSPTLTVTGGADGTRILIKNTTNQSCKFPAGSKDVPINTLVEYIYASGTWQWIASSIVNATWDVKGNLFIDSTTDFIGTLSNQPIVFKTANVERMKLNSNGTFSTQGSVGIGVANPNDKLAVAGSVNVTGEIKPNGSSGVAGTVLTSNGNGTMQWAEAKTNGSVGFGPWGDCSTNAISEYNPVADANGEIFDRFGSSVSISGNYAIVGARNDDVGANIDQGSVSIYQFNGVNWVLMQKITDAMGASNDNFGNSVSISGNYAIVGANEDDVGANADQGSVSIYQLTGGSWVLMQKITDATGAASDFFGNSVSISGNYVIVGAFADDIGANPNQGSANIYQLTGGSWVLMQKIADATGATGDFFGISVCISDNYAIVGASSDDVGVNIDQGSSSIYQLTSGSWVLMNKITDATGVNYDNFGNSVSISGNYAIVGASNDDVGANADQGSVSIYQLTGGSWVLMQKITDATGAASDYFGVSVFISGNYVIVGASNDDVGANVTQGSATAYQRIGLGWQKVQYIIDPSGVGSVFGIGGDRFGSKVSIDATSKRFLISAIGYASSSGKVVFGKLNF